MVDAPFYREGARFLMASQESVNGSGEKDRKTFQTFDLGSKSVVYCKASLLTMQTAQAKAKKQRGVRKKSVQTLK